MIIDIHAHILTERTLERLQHEAPEQAPRFLDVSDEAAVLAVGDSIRYAGFPRGAWDLERRLADMNTAGIDLQALSVVPFIFCYNLDPGLGAVFARIQNEEIAIVVRENPDRFVGLATVPLQSPIAASDELRRAMSEGFRGASICTNVNGKNLDAEEFDVFWATAEELGAFIFIHPQNVAAKERLGAYHLINLLGNPIDTSIAIGSLIFGGVLERYPSLTLCFAHGGGFIPYQWGRLVHGWKVRPEARIKLKRSPEGAIGSLYFDTILHSSVGLDFLIRVVGEKHVVLGSDYPFDMRLEKPVAEVAKVASLDDGGRAAVLGVTAHSLLALPPARKEPEQSSGYFPGSTSGT